jgi:hypothetical protein
LHGHGQWRIVETQGFLAPRHVVRVGRVAIAVVRLLVIVLLYVVAVWCGRRGHKQRGRYAFDGSWIFQHDAVHAARTVELERDGFTLLLLKFVDIKRFGHVKCLMFMIIVDHVDLL